MSYKTKKNLSEWFKKYVGRPVTYKLGKVFIWYVSVWCSFVTFVCWALKFVPVIFFWGTRAVIFWAGNFSNLLGQWLQKLIVEACTS